MKTRKIAFSLACLVTSLSLLGGGILISNLLRNDDTNATIYGDNSTYVMVDEIYKGNGEFDKTNFQTLLNYLGNADNTTMSQVDALGVKTSEDLRANTFGKTNSQDIEVTLGGLQWEAVYLSKDMDGNTILTLWLDNCQQSAWRERAADEGEFYGFLNSGLYSDWSANWYSSTTKDGTAGFYPSAMYGTSYIRAVTLNNGGQYATSNTALHEAVGQSESNVFATFTMDKFGLTQYLVKPEKVEWQKDQSSKTIQGTDYNHPNDAWNTETLDEGFYSSAYNYAEHNGYDAWKGDYLWLPSLTETGYSSTYKGIWNLSNDQRKNLDGTSTSSQGVAGSGNGTSTATPYSWLRSGSRSSASSSYYLYPSGSTYSYVNVTYSRAVRPSLHINLDSAASAATQPRSKWKNNAAESYSAGEGSEENPYEIATGAELALMSKEIGAGTHTDSHFRLSADIFLGEHVWSPIGTSANPFAGTFDGNGYRIYGMEITSGDYQGLFGYSSGTIKNVYLDNGTITAGNNSGSIVGSNSGLVDSCTSSAEVVGVDKVGGLVGVVAGGGKVQYSFFIGIVRGTTNVGGIAGECAGEVTQCVTDCKVTGETVGGLVGSLSGQLSYSTASGALMVSGESGTLVATNTGTVTACSFYGTANTKLTAFAGSGTVNYCYARVNTDKVLSSALSEEWLDHWTVLNIARQNIVPKKLYAIAGAIASTLAELQTALAGFVVA